MDGLFDLPEHESFSGEVDDLEWDAFEGEGFVELEGGADGVGVHRLLGLVFPSFPCTSPVCEYSGERERGGFTRERVVVISQVSPSAAPLRMFPIHMSKSPETDQDWSNEFEFMIQRIDLFHGFLIESFIRSKCLICCPDSHTPT